MNNLGLWIKENCPELDICDHISKYRILNQYVDNNPLTHFKFSNVYCCPTCNKLYFIYMEIRISAEDFIFVTYSIPIVRNF